MERYFFAALKYVKNCGNNQMLVLVNHFKSAENIWCADENTLLKSKFISEESIQSLISLRKQNVVERLAESCEKNNIRVVCYDDEEYPVSLKSIVSAPASIFVKGLALVEQENSLAVVGPRTASNYGKEVVDYLVGGLADYNFCVISGGARGIDTIAHRKALQLGMPTISVLGCGLDIDYPVENRKLFEDISQRGSLVSEYPPGTPPIPKNFPARNRIISGLSKGVLLVEAAQRSGSLITAEFALDQGREVYCVPGNIFSSNSVGVHKLLKQGAKLVTSPMDILEDYYKDGFTIVSQSILSDDLTNLNVQNEEQSEQLISDLRTKDLTKEQHIVWNILSDSIPMSMEDMMLDCNIDIGTLNLTVLELEIMGYIKMDNNNRKYIKVRGVQ